MSDYRYRFVAFVFGMALVIVAALVARAVWTWCG